MAGAAAQLKLRGDEQQIGALTAQRELKARELAKAQANEKAADEELKVRTALHGVFE